MVSSERCSWLQPRPEHGVPEVLEIGDERGFCALGLSSRLEDELACEVRAQTATARGHDRGLEAIRRIGMLGEALCGTLRGMADIQAAAAASRAPSPAARTATRDPDRVDPIADSIR